MRLRSVSELASVAAPAWPDLGVAIDTGSADVRVLSVEPAKAEQTLHALQVTTGSVLGALAYHCGGILIDHGWIRMLGGGTDRLPSLATANGLGDPAKASSPPPFLVVAFDVLGGRFAIDGGGLGLAPGEVCYWAPDTLSWEALGLGHGAFVNAFLQGAGTDFYQAWRWQDWEREIGVIPADQGLSLFPPPFAAEGVDLGDVSRRPIPFSELISFYDDMALKVNDVAPGDTFRLTVSDRPDARLAPTEREHQR